MFQFYHFYNQISNKKTSLAFLYSQFDVFQKQ